MNVSLRLTIYSSGAIRVNQSYLGAIRASFPRFFVILLPISSLCYISTHPRVSIFDIFRRYRNLTLVRHGLIHLWKKFESCSNQLIDFNTMGKFVINGLKDFIVWKPSYDSLHNISATDQNICYYSSAFYRLTVEWQFFFNSTKLHKCLISAINFHNLM